MIPRTVLLVFDTDSLAKPAPAISMLDSTMGLVCTAATGVTLWTARAAALLACCGIRLPPMWRTAPRPAERRGCWPTIPAEELIAAADMAVNYGKHASDVSA
mmetsp:Transcript_15772/g.44141  ORF Transcript_15772/g.44141 Transcript_15772/m.44141 type:complete len:102 (+) Transcript_15772:1405-1710(+)